MSAEFVHPVNSPEFFGVFEGDDAHSSFNTDSPLSTDPIVDYTEADQAMGLSPDPDPIKFFETTRFEGLTPADAQAAINAIVPGSETALSDAEVILGVVAHVALENPTMDWDDMMDRATKIYNRERDSAIKKQMALASASSVKYPESPEEERARINKWLSQNQAELVARLTKERKDTYGLEDSSYEEYPAGWIKTD